MRPSSTLLNVHLSQHVLCHFKLSDPAAVFRCVERHCSTFESPSGKEGLSPPFSCGYSFLLLLPRFPWGTGRKKEKKELY